jgi:DNA-binding YbaB/EbfC family protein
MNIQKMMKQAQEMQKKLADMQSTLEATEMEGSAGNGAVVVRLNGKGQLLNITLNPSVVVAEDKDLLEDLIVAAHNDAKDKIDAAAADGMGKVTGGMNLPAGLKLPF